ncbi:MAG: hypothetical protein ACRD1V_21075 [Vicinamibacterales bacterium]
MTKNWAPTALDFNNLIVWLDAGVASDGQSYVDMQARLIAYFTRKGCTRPEDLADDTLARVGRRLQEEGSITGVAPAQYCYIVARFVLLEYFRIPENLRVGIDGDVRQTAESRDARRERLLDGLDQCLAQLNLDDRALILAYYSGDPASRIAARRDLAARCSISLNALTIRASRLRERLRICLAQLKDS